MLNEMSASFGGQTIGLPVSVLIVLLAGIVRGFSGFGFSLLAITALALLQPLATFVPTIFLLEVAASLHMLPGIWRSIHWRSIRWLMLGNLLGFPAGMFFLVSLPASPLQLGLGILVIGTALLMLRGFNLSRTPGPGPTTVTGTVAGMLNGAFGIGGPPVILFYFSTPGAAATGRASVIAYFLCTDVLGLMFQTNAGLVSWHTLTQFVFWLPALLLGLGIGMHGFKRMDPVRFRRAVLFILLGLAVITIVKSVAGLASA